MAVTAQPAPLGHAFADGELARRKIPEIGANRSWIPIYVLKLKIG